MDDLSLKQMCDEIGLTQQQRVAFCARTALHRAVNEDDETAVIAAIDSLPATHVDAPLFVYLDAQGVTPLMLVSIYGYSCAVSALLSRGVSVNDATDTQGWTALFYACDNAHHDDAKHNSFECAKLLLEADGDVDQMCNSRCPPLIHACKSGNMQIVKLLSSYGANRTWPQFTAESVARSYSIIHMVPALVPWLERSRHWTPLHHLEQLTPPRRATNLIR